MISTGRSRIPMSGGVSGGVKGQFLLGELVTRSQLVVHLPQR